jgi:cephamycin C biosynthesis protein
VSTALALLYYGAPLTPMGREDNWVIDAVSQPPKIICNFRKIAVKKAITNFRD